MAQRKINMKMINSIKFVVTNKNAPVDRQVVLDLIGYIEEQRRREEALVDILLKTNNKVLESNEFLNLTVFHPQS